MKSQTYDSGWLVIATLKSEIREAQAKIKHCKRTIELLERELREMEKEGRRL
jgi:hypothetical protein